MADTGQVNLEGDLLLMLNRAKSMAYNDNRGTIGKESFRNILKFLKQRLEDGEYDNVILDANKKVDKQDKK